MAASVAIDALRYRSAHPIKLIETVEDLEKRGIGFKSLTEKDIQAIKAMLADPDITVEEVAGRLQVAASTLSRHLPRDGAGFDQAFGFSVD